MPVSARTSQNGEHIFKPGKVVYDTIIIKEDGRTYDDNFANRFYDEHRCSRYMVKSPKFQIDGTSTWFRNATDYERSVLDRQFTRGSYLNDRGWYYSIGHWYNEDSNRKWDYNPAAFDDEAVIWSNELESEAIAKAIAKMKGQRAGIGEDLATARQTYTMLEESGRLLLNTALAAKRGNLPAVWAALKDGRSAIRQGSNIFLQYKYGWKPLMDDIHGLTNLLKDQLKPAFLLNADAKSHRENVTPVINDGNYERQLLGDSYRQTRVSLWGVIDPNVNRLGDSLGLSNPLSLAWELVPWSFVVDWFIPVGSTLDALTAPQGVNFLTGSCTTRGETSFTSKIVPGSAVELEPASNTVRIFSIRRRAYSDWPKAGFFAVNPFTSAHGQSAFALLLQKFKI